MVNLAPLPFGMHRVCLCPWGGVHCTTLQQPLPFLVILVVNLALFVYLLYSDSMPLLWGGGYHDHLSFLRLCLFDLLFDPWGRG